MPATDPRVDTYINNAADFAKPILKHIRNLVHQACPEIQETIKWGMPFFDYKGTVCNIASFKQHCAFGFWKSKLMPDPYNLLKENSGEAMGQFGRISSLEDLPDDEIIIEYIQNAVQLNLEGKKTVKKPVAKLTEITIPDFFSEALENHPTAKETFEKFSFSHKKEYIQWIVEAKTEATRTKRVNTALEWLSEGKSRNWKYER